MPRSEPKKAERDDRPKRKKAERSDLDEPRRPGDSSRETGPDRPRIPSAQRAG